MNRQLIALSLAGVCAAAGVGGYFAGREQPSSSTVTAAVPAPVATATNGLTDVPTPGAATSSEVAAAPGAATSGATTVPEALGNAPGTSAAPEDTSEVSPAPRTGQDGAPATGRASAPGAQPETAQRGTTGRTDPGSSSSPDSAGRSDSRPKSPEPRKTSRGGGGGTPTSGADARAKWASMSEAERQAMIARYKAMSPAEQKRVRAIACQQYGVC